MRVLLVEDDELLGDGLKNALHHERYTVDWLKDGVAALHAVKSEIFDVIVLDLGLPRKSGLEFLLEARDAGVTTPVLILTARETVENRIRGLDCGADDYMTKPFEVDELSARLRALLRRSVGRADTTISYRNIELDPASHSVRLDGEEIKMPRREFALLQKLIEHSGKVISREQLMQSLYGWQDDVDSNALEVHIHNLRKRLKADYIRTIRGVGYMAEREPN